MTLTQEQRVSVYWIVSGWVERNHANNNLSDEERAYYERILHELKESR